MSAPTVPAAGTRMPDFPLVPPDGPPTTLAAQRGGSRAVVYFLRAAGCPVCLRHARTLARMAAEGELGAQVRVLLVAPGGAAEAAQLAGRVPDRDDRVSVWASGEGHAAAGLGSFLGLQHSGTFAVDADGSVLHARTATLPPAAFSRRDLLRDLGR